MDLIISLLMGTRLLALFGGGLGSEAAPVFLEPKIIVAAQEVRLTCILANAFPPELKNLAQTATPVVIYLVITVSESDTRRTIKKVTAQSRMVYDMIGRRYCLIKSIPRDTMWLGTIDSAIAASVTFTGVPVLSRREIQKELSYVFSAQAILGKARVAALDNKEIDCMYYWNYKRPTFSTSALLGERFTVAARP